MVNVGLVAAAAVLLVIGAATEASPILWLSIVCAVVAFFGMVVGARLARHREAGAAVAPAVAGWSAATAATTSSTATVPDREPAEPEPALTAETPSVVERAPAPAPGRRRRRAFPIEDYDTMRVREILPVLEDLDAEDLEVVRRHEVEGKNRSTVVRRADALLAELRAQRGVEEEEAVPIDDYDRMRVRDILPILDHLDPDDLEMVRRYETDTKNRPTIVRRIDQLVAAAEEAEGEEDLELEEVLEIEEEEEVVLTEEPVVEPEPEPVPVAAGSFPIEDYDQRRMGEILSIIEGLDEADLRLVAQREYQGQRRAVIINKIDALAPGTAAALRARPPAPPRRARTGRTAAPAPPVAAASRRPARPTTAPLPIEDYDAMSARELLPRLDDLDVVQLEWVRRHEQEGKSRSTVLRRIDQLMARRQGGGAVEEETMPTARLDRVT